ncbi:transposase, partial [Paraburkholderia sp. BR14263]
DNRRVSGSPSRTNRGAAVRKPKPLPGARKQREVTLEDLNAAVGDSPQPGRLGAKNPLQIDIKDCETTTPRTNLNPDICI